MPKRILWVVVLVGMAAPAWAKDWGAPRKQAADQVVAAVAAGDKAALARFAYAERPGPWRLAEELCGRGAYDAALALAEAIDHPDVEGLAAYVKRRQASKDEGGLEALDAFNALWSARKAKEGIAHLEQVALQRERYVGLLASYWLILVHQNMGQVAKAEELCLAFAPRAETWGCASLVEGCWQTAFECALTRGAAPQVWLDYCEKRLAVARTRPDRKTLHVALLNVGNGHQALANFRQSVPYFRESLQLATEYGDREGRAKALAMLGASLGEMGKLEEGVEAQEEAMRIFEALGNQQGVALVIGNLSTALNRLGDRSKELSLLETALKIATEAKDEDEIARLRNNLGVTYASLGQYERALRYFEPMRAHLEQTNDELRLVGVLLSIGSALTELGRYEAALATLERALALARKTGQPTREGHVLYNLGALHERQGDDAGALPFFRKSLELLDKGGDIGGLAMARRSIAAALHNLDKHAEAVPLYEQLVVESRASGATESLVMSLTGLAQALEALQRYDEAIEAAREAVDQLGRIVRGQGDEVAAAARSRFVHTFQVGVVAAAKADRPADALHFIESGRAGALLEALGGAGAVGEAALPKALLAADAKASRDLAAATLAFGRLRRLGTEKALGQARDAVEKAREAHQGVVERIQREAKTAADVVYPRAAALADVQAMLADGEVLVLYAAFGAQAYAVTVRKDGARVLPLGATEAIAAAGAALLADTRGEADRTRLERLVVAPLGLGPRDQRVLISPSGALAYVPFALLLGDRAFVLVPSGTTLRLLRQTPTAAGRGVLALGNPSYGEGARTDPAAQRLRSGFDLVALPESEDEARSVGDVVLIGRDATEARLRAELAKRERWKALHLACHGLVDPVNPAFSALAVTPAGDDDGFLTALEVFRMSVPADLVVLSACETGKGKVYAGEGMVGLMRAFLFAGSPRVLVSLWKVDDRATRLLMEAFYELWSKQGLPAATALQRARASVRDHEETGVDREASRKAGRTIEKKTRPFADPAYWSGWTLWGLPE